MPRQSSARTALEAEYAQEVELARRRAELPLAYATMWHSDRTSQRHAIRDLLAPDLLLGLLFGGNRTGKSTAMSDVAQAMALGEDACLTVQRGRSTAPSWPVRRWLSRNGLPAGCIPRGPGRVWVASASFPAACEQIRLTLRARLPLGTRYVTWDQPKEARVVLPGGGEIVSKAYKQYDQDPQTWEGGNIRFAGVDEQPNQPANLEALYARLVDQNGRAIMALTPLRGKSDWLWKNLAKPGVTPDWALIRYLHGDDNPYIPQTARRRMIAATNAWQRASRDRGEFTDPQGGVYSFSQGTHVIDPVDPPAHWIRWVGIDWGARSPHVVWLAEDPDDGSMIVYRELAPRKESHEPAITTRQLIAEAKRLEAREETPGAIYFRVADNSPEPLAEAAALGWYCEAAEKGRGSIRDGIEVVEGHLQPVDPVTLAPRIPRLRITSDCPQLIEELGGLRWLETPDPDAAGVDPRCPDHGPDALRYLLAWRQGQGFRRAA